MKKIVFLLLAVVFMFISTIEAVDLQTGDWVTWRPNSWSPVPELILPALLVERICTDEEDIERNIEVFYFHYDQCREADGEGDCYLRTANPRDGVRSQSKFSERVSSGTWNRVAIFRPVDETRIADINDRTDSLVVGGYDWKGYYAYAWDAILVDRLNGWKINCLKRDILRGKLNAPYLVGDDLHCLSFTFTVQCGVDGDECGIDNVQTFNPIAFIRDIRSGENTDYILVEEYEIMRDGELMLIE